MKSFGLPRSRRLKSRKQLQAVFEKGRRLRSKSVQLIYTTGEGTGGLQFGVGVSARHFKRAVDRNRIKRRLRESCRLQQGPLQDWTRDRQSQVSVFLLYTGRELPDFTALLEESGRLFQKLIIALDAANTQNT